MCEFVPHQASIQCCRQFIWIMSDIKKYYYFAHFYIRTLVYMFLPTTTTTKNIPIYFNFWSFQFKLASRGIILNILDALYSGKVNGNVTGKSAQASEKNVFHLSNVSKREREWERATTKEMKWMSVEAERQSAWHLVEQRTKNIRMLWGQCNIYYSIFSVNTKYG